MANNTYNRTIRKLIVAFGDMFKDITMVRYNPDRTEQSRIIVPITYAPKEQYAMRLHEDPDLNKKVQITLPRLSYEMTSFAYDASRKLNTNTKSFAQTPSGMLSQYNPVPYNFDFSLYLYVRNIEDGAQILERILPYFTPDYTLKLNLIPEMGIVKEVPVILNSSDQDIQYEGNRESEPRLVIWTLNFTVKAYIFGNISSANVITHSITSIYNQLSGNDPVRFTMNPNGQGSYKLDEFVYQGYNIHNATATGKVQNWANNKLTLIGVEGDFVSTAPIKGGLSGAMYYYTSYDLDPIKLVQIDITPNPPNANASSLYTANTIITEYPNIE